MNHKNAQTNIDSTFQTRHTVLQNDQNRNKSAQFQFYCTEHIHYNWRNPSTPTPQFFRPQAALEDEKVLGDPIRFIWRSPYDNSPAIPIKHLKWNRNSCADRCIKGIVINQILASEQSSITWRDITDDSDDDEVELSRVSGSRFGTAGGHFEPRHNDGSMCTTSCTCTRVYNLLHNIYTCVQHHIQHTKTTAHCHHL